MTSVSSVDSTPKIVPEIERSAARSSPAVSQNRGVVTPDSLDLPARQGPAEPDKFTFGENVLRGGLAVIVAVVAVPFFAVTAVVLGIGKIAEHMD
jgi:hypothetical protein